MQQSLQLADGTALAYRHLGGDGPGIVFFPGFNSDMQGNKAVALQAWCQQRGQQFTSLDYFGHGESSGKLEEGSIGRWRNDALAVLDGVTSGPQILVGSSMGGWIMLLVALARPERVAGLVGIAAAPDFTEHIRSQRLDTAQLQQLADTGYCDMSNGYDDGLPYRISAHMLNEAPEHFLLGKPQPVDVPVRLIHGQLDADVPWQHSLAIAESLRSADVEVQLVKSGDHRLSQPDDLQRLQNCLEQLLQQLRRQ